MGPPGCVAIYFNGAPLQVILLQHAVQFLDSGCPVAAELSDCTVNRQGPTKWHVRFVERISTVFNDGSNMGTSIVALKLTISRLLFQVSTAKSPFSASRSTAGN